MYLYNKNGSDLEVYDIYTSNSILADYKRRELIGFEKDGNEILYQLITYPATHEKIAFNTIRRCDTMSYSLLEYKKNFHEWSKLIPQTLYRHCIIRKYLNGEYKKRPVAKITDEDLLVKHYFMGIQNCSCDRKDCRLNSLLNLPESLYYLQLLELGNYKELVNADSDLFDKLASMYNIELINKYDINLLEELYFNGIGTNPTSILQNAEYNKEVLQRVRTAKK